MGMKVIRKESRDADQVQPYMFLHPPHADEASTSNSSQRREGRPPEPSVAAEEEVATSSRQAQAVKAAYEEGFREGEKAGAAAVEKRLDAVEERYGESLLELDRLRSTLYSQIEREVVKLAVEVARKIVRREIQADPEIVQTLIRVALSRVAEKSTVTVHVHPSDYNYLLERRAELASGTREIVLVSDRAIEQGGCLVQTDCGEIDARIDQQFREVERVFFNTH